MILSALDEAVKQEIVTKNISKGVTRPKSQTPPKKIRALTIEEHKKLLSVADKCKYSTQLKLELAGGFRMGEINALTLSDVDFNANIININKTISRLQSGKAILNNRPKTFAGNRKVVMSADVRNILHDYITYHYKDNPLKMLFLSRDNSPVTTTQVNLAFKRL